MNAAFDTRAPHASTPTWTLREVAELAEGRLHSPEHGATSFDYRAISTDTRSLRSGDFFVALRGERFDAHAYLEQVVAGGACGALIDRPLVSTPLPQVVVDDSLEGWQRWGKNHLGLWRAAPVPALAVEDAERAERAVPRTITAITGSSGKTTTKDLLAHMLAGSAPVWSTEGNRNNHVGVPWTLLGLSPDHRYAVVELGMNHAGEIAQLSRLCTPDVAVLTGVGRAHVGHLGSREGVLRAKLEILEGLVGGAPLVVAHDPWILDRLPQDARNRPRITFGMDRKADWSPLRAPRYTLHGTRFETETTGEVELSLLGEGAVRSALAALATLDALGLDARALAPRLRTAQPRELRMELRRSSGGVQWLLDCYNASPESSRLAMQFVAGVPHSGRRVLVFGELGELGDSSDSIHRELGKTALGFDLAIFLGPATRVSMEALKEAGGTYPIVWMPDLEAASAYLAAGLRSGDLVLLKASRRWALERILEQVPPPLSPVGDAPSQES